MVVVVVVVVWQSNRIKQQALYMLCVCYEMKREEKFYFLDIFNLVSIFNTSNVYTSVCVCDWLESYFFFFCSSILFLFQFDLIQYICCDFNERKKNQSIQQYQSIDTRYNDIYGWIGINFHSHRFFFFFGYLVSCFFSLSCFWFSMLIFNHQNKQTDIIQLKYFSLSLSPPRSIIHFYIFWMHNFFSCPFCCVFFCWPIFSFVVVGSV